MLYEVLVFLRNHLNAHLRTLSGGRPDETREDAVVFIDGEKMDPVTFKLGAVSVLLINMQEETTLRAPDLYSRVAANGDRQAVQPEIRLNLYVLFVAHFKQYEDALRYLSLIIQHFQNHRVFTPRSAPELDDDIEQLIVELNTLSFAEQNEVWNALRTTYHPSVLYKVKMVVFRDGDAITAPTIAEKQIGISQL